MAVATWCWHCMTPYKHIQYISRSWCVAYLQELWCVSVRRVVLNCSHYPSQSLLPGPSGCWCHYTAAGSPSCQSPSARWCSWRPGWKKTHSTCKTDTEQKLKRDSLHNSRCLTRLTPGMFAGVAKFGGFSFENENLLEESACAVTTFHLHSFSQVHYSFCFTFANDIRKWAV